jgi:predicted transcriptional regulator of viral defense system
MTPTTVQSVWALVRSQHGVVARRQLIALGYSSEAIRHRIARGRLHPIWRGVYALGRPQLTREGRWMAAILACGPDAVLSHPSAAALWGLMAPRAEPARVPVPARGNRRPAGIVVHRRAALTSHDVARRRGIPVTTVAVTLVDSRRPSGVTSSKPRPTKPTSSTSSIPSGSARPSTGCGRGPGSPCCRRPSIAGPSR